MYVCMHSLILKISHCTQAKKMVLVHIIHYILGFERYSVAEIYLVQHLNGNLQTGNIGNLTSEDFTSVGCHLVIKKKSCNILSSIPL